MFPQEEEENSRVQTTTKKNVGMYRFQEIPGRINLKKNNVFVDPKKLYFHCHNFEDSSKIHCLQQLAVRMVTYLH